MRVTALRAPGARRHVRPGPPPLLLIYSVTVTGILNNTLIGPAIPDILDAFDQPHSRAGLLVASGALPGIVVAPLIGVLADRFGRRPVFIGFVLAAAVLVPVYGLAGRWPGLLLALGPFVGFFGHGYFSVFGALLAELFPTRIRATAQGLCYNAGRALSALAPFSLGVVADRHGIGAALTLTAGFYILGAALMFLLPETRAREVQT